MRSRPSSSPSPIPPTTFESWSRDVCLRLDGRSDKAYRKLSVNYGGGKTHTLITLWHLAHEPEGLPDLPAVREFEAHIDFRAAQGPRRRVVLRQDRPGKGHRDPWT